MSENNNPPQKKTGAVIFGIVNIVLAAIMPPIGGVLGIIGLVLGIKKNCKVGIILNIVALVVALVRGLLHFVLMAS